MTNIYLINIMNVSILANGEDLSLHIAYCVTISDSE